MVVAPVFASKGTLRMIGVHFQLGGSGSGCIVRVLPVVVDGDAIMVELGVTVVGVIVALS